MQEIITGVINKVGLCNLVVTGQKDNMVRISVNGREQWVTEGDVFTIVSASWRVDKIYPVKYDDARILSPNETVAVLSPA